MYKYSTRQYLKHVLGFLGFWFTQATSKNYRKQYLQVQAVIKLEIIKSDYCIKYIPTEQSVK